MDINDEILTIQKLIEFEKVAHLNDCERKLLINKPTASIKKKMRRFQVKEAVL
jgi:hypothetical protein